MTSNKLRKECNSLLPRFIPITTSSKDGCDADLKYYRHKIMEALKVPPEAIRELSAKSST